MTFPVGTTWTFWRSRRTSFPTAKSGSSNDVQTPLTGIPSGEFVKFIILPITRPLLNVELKGHCPNLVVPATVTRQ
jgi:hypothetical protein